MEFDTVILTIAFFSVSIWNANFYNVYLEQFIEGWKTTNYFITVCTQCFFHAVVAKWLSRFNIYSSHN